MIRAHALEEVLIVAKMVRCKVCGYVMPEGRLKDKCPACGVAAKAFEPWEDPLSEDRRRALALDLHPIAVHFPTAFVVSLLVIFLVGLAFDGRGAAGLFLCAGRLLSLFLPLLVAAAFLLGVRDGVVRFRSVGRSEILKKKVLFGLLYFAFALAVPLVVWLWGVEATPLAVALVLSAAGLACNVVLSLLGTSVLGSAMPGK